MSRLLCGGVALILMAIIYGNTICQAQSLRGSVLDSLGQAIPGASVTLHARDSSILTFSRTGSDGRFALRASANAHFIRAQALGHNGQEILLAGIPAQDSISFILFASYVQLNEVNVHARQSIVERGDTISYRLEAFSDQTERSLEDILAKLPGFEVSESGTISVNGTPIRKILVEGDDLVDQNYQLLSKNLSAGLVEEVDLINKYLDNPLLKGIEQSEDLALNIKLKDKGKRLFFGDIALDGGTSDRYGLLANGVVLSKSTKAYLLANGNNYGTDINPHMGSVYVPASSTLSNAFAPAMLNRQMVQLEPRSTSLVDKKRTFFNQAGLASANLVNNSLKNLTWRSNVHFFQDRNPLSYEKLVTYFIPDDTFQINELHDFAQKPTWLRADLNLRYLPNEKSSVDYRLNYTHGENAIANQLLFNQAPIAQHVQNKTSLLDTRINYLYKSSPNSAVIADVAYINNELPQTLSISPFHLNFIENNVMDSIGTAAQTASNPLSYMGGQVKFLNSSTTGNSNKGVALGYDNYNERLHSQLNDGELTENPGFFNDYRLRRHKVFLNGHWMEQLGKWNLTLKGGINFQSLNLRDGAAHGEAFRQSQFYPGLDARVNWRVSARNRFVLSYAYDQELPLLSTLYGGYIVTDYRNASRYVTQENTIHRHLSMLRYTFNNSMQQFSANASVSFAQQVNGYTQSLTIMPEFVMSTGFPIAQGNKSWSFNGGFDKLIAPLNIVLKIQSTNSRNEFYNTLNGLGRQVRSWLLINQASAISTFPGLFNFNFNVRNYTTINQVNIEEGVEQLSNKNTIWRSSLQLRFRLHEDFSFKINGAYYRWQNNEFDHFNTYFMDAEGEWFAVKNKLSFRFMFNNLYNQRNLVFSNINDYQSVQNQYLLQPRTLLLGVKFHF